jgi:hypothetical protein
LETIQNYYILTFSPSTHLLTPILIVNYHPDFTAIRFPINSRTKFLHAFLPSSIRLTSPPLQHLGLINLNIPYHITSQLDTSSTDSKPVKAGSQHRCPNYVNPMSSFAKFEAAPMRLMTGLTLTRLIAVFYFLLSMNKLYHQTSH